MYFEARGEPAAGQAAVARVILNRVASRAYPDSICGVVYENADRKNACQFSFACDGKSDRISEHVSWGRILVRAAIMLAREGECAHGTASAGMISISTNYHATYVSPEWAQHLIKTGQIGNHVFYYEERAGGLNIAARAGERGARQASA